MSDFLRFEELEERIAPTIITAGGSLTFTDGDGDQVQISYYGPAGSQADVTDGAGGDMDDGDSIGWINVTNSDYTSALLVENLGGGNDRTDILDGVQSATPGADFGVIALGIDIDGANAGAVDLASGGQILVDGNLGMLVINGDLNFEGAGGHLVVAQGDIGLVDVHGDMALDPTNGAKILAGGGSGDISFIRVGGQITVGAAGPALQTVDVAANPTFYDDAGDGTSGVMTVKVSGTGATGALTLIPIMDGGYVLSKLDVSNASTVTIAAAGDGGDITEIVATDAIGKVTISGVPDTDLYSISGAGIASVADRSVGGDIIGVHSSAAIGTIQTQRLGNLGSAFTGATNSVPQVVRAGLSEMGGTDATDGISSIKVGGVLNTTIEAASLASLRANPGGISGIGIDIAGSIGTIQAANIEDSAIYAETGVSSVKVGPTGISGSEISSRGVISSVQTNGSITDSLISTEFDDAGTISGSSIAKIQAGSVFNSAFAAFEGFGSVKVRGAFVTSTVMARFTDSGLGDVGGPVGSFSAGGMYLGSMVKAYGDISSVSLGTGGMVQTSEIDTTGSLLKVSVRGDVSNSSIINATAGVGSVSISGDLAYNARVGTSGNMTSLTLGGGIIGGDVLVAGNLGKFSARGGIHGFGVSFGVGGDVGSFSVSGGINGRTLGSETLIDILGNVTSFNVKGGMNRTDLHVGGDVTKLSAAAGGTAFASAIDIEGNLTSGKIRGTNTTLIVDGNVGSLQLLSDAPMFGVNVGGTVGAISVNGTITSGTIDLDGNVGSLTIKGDVNNTDIDFGEDGSPVSVTKLTIGGAVADSNVDAWGNVGQVSVKGSFVNSGVNIRGDLTSMSTGRGIYHANVTVEGQAGKFTVNNAIHESSTLFYGGISEYAVKGSIYNVDIGTTNYDGGGDPLGGAIGKITAQDINGANIFAYGGIGEIKAKGTIYGSVIEAVGRDNSGAGSVVGGDSITKISAKGLNGTDVLAYSDIVALTLSDEGISSDSTVEALTGDLGSITTKGLIFGEITVGGDLTGSISSAGTDAVDLGTDVNYYFCDANGNITGGTLDVTGVINGTVS